MRTVLPALKLPILGRPPAMKITPLLIAASLAAISPGAAQTAPAFSLKRCEVIPLPEHQVSLRIDGEEKVRWHFGPQYPRPFFFPLKGPSGATLTRMGHPGAENHDHHRSVWFAHNKLNGLDFWSEQAPGRIRQLHWYRYRDGDDEAVMAAKLGWFDGGGTQIAEQDVIAALRPMEGGESALEIQMEIRPAAGAAPVVLEKTNFGFFAVRVAATISTYFGGGVLTNSEGATGEPAIFGKPARWMDYSGPVAVGEGPDRRAVTEGVTYFDHPRNPRHPVHWHVREDGWMGAAFCLQEGLEIPAGSPLVLRYLLHAHGGAYDSGKAEAVFRAFADRPAFHIRKPSKEEKHRQYEVERLPAP